MLLPPRETVGLRSVCLTAAVFILALETFHSPFSPSLVLSSRLWLLICMSPLAHSEYCLRVDSKPMFDANTCKWEPAGDRGAIAWLCESPVDVGYCSTDDPKVTVERCETDAGWTAFRAGPFVTHGGYDWNGLQMTLNPKYIPSCRVDGVHAISEYIVGQADEQSNLIGSPPILVHHLHFSGSGNPFEAIINVHSDSQCHSELGGVSCLKKSAPPGTAFYLRDGIVINTEFNDLRPNGSEPFESYVFVAYKLMDCDTMKPIRQVRMTELIVPIIDGNRATYVVQTAIDSVIWTAGTFGQLVENPLPTLIEAYFHSHNPMIHDIWFFQGSPEKVFSNVSLVQQSHNKILYGKDIIQTTMNNIERRALDGNAAVLACNYRALPDEVIDGMKFHRKSRCSLDPNVADWVMVVFHRNLDNELKVPIFRLHTTLRLHYAGPSDGTVMLRKPTDSAIFLPFFRARGTDEMFRASVHMRYAAFGITEPYPEMGSLIEGTSGEVMHLWP